MFVFFYYLPPKTFNLLNMNVIPAILEPDFQSILKELTLLRGLTKKVQIDLSDGISGALKTWLPSQKEILPDEFSYEFDVMLYDWKGAVTNCLLQKASSIVVHVDNYNDEDLMALVTMIKPHHVELGISVSNDKSYIFHKTTLNKIKLLYGNVFVQVMGMRQVVQRGQPFDEEVLKRVAYFKKDFPGMLVQVDGGVNVGTIGYLHDAFVDTVIVGSAIFVLFDVKVAFESLKAKAR